MYGPCKDLVRFDACTGVCGILSAKTPSEKEKLGVIFYKG